VAQGRLYGAAHAATTRARVFLEADQPDKALQAFRLGAEEFRSPVSAWCEAQMLRIAGKQVEAEKRAHELRKNHPRSVPAQFLHPEPGDQWWTPYNQYLLRYERLVKSR